MSMRKWQEVQELLPQAFLSSKRLIWKSVRKTSEMKVANLFDGIPDDLPEELFIRLHQAKGLRIERIVSQGQASPPGFCYDQCLKEIEATKDPENRSDRS